MRWGIQPVSNCTLGCRQTELKKCLARPFMPPKRTSDRVNINEYRCGFSGAEDAELRYGTVVINFHAEGKRT